MPDRWAVALCASLVALPASAAAPAPQRLPAKGVKLDCGEVTATSWARTSDAFAEVLRQSDPLVLGVGEYHQLEGGPKVKSALKRFTESMLPQLKGRASDLVAETWITNGRCGKVEAQAKEQIEKETQRPAQTEDEVLLLLRTASDLGVEPHILKVECEDYQDLLQPDGSLDSEKVLALVTRLMRDKALEISAKRPGKMVVIYGGAVHNDVDPPQPLKEFSFGPDLVKATGDRYVQLGAYVPELLASDDDIKKTDWWPCVQKHASKSATLLVQPRPQTFLVIFPKAK